MKLETTMDEIMFVIENEKLGTAINSGWESLNLPSGSFIAILKGNKGSLVLEVTGEVEIIDTETDTKYVGDERFKDKELMSAIAAGEINNGRYIVDSNNWFSVVILDQKDEVVEDVVFESCPLSMEEFRTEMTINYLLLLSSSKSGSN